MKKNVLLGSVILLSVFGILSKVIGAVYRIPLTYILTSEGMGLYQMVFPLYSLLLAVSSSGFPASMSKLISSYNAKNEYKKAKSILKNSIFMLLIFSSISALIVSIFGKRIAIMQGNPDAGILYFAISPALIFVGVISGLRGYFQGNENMVPTSVGMLIEQVGKLAFGLLFAKLLLPRGVVYATLGAILAVVISEILCLAFLLVYYKYYKANHPIDLSQGDELSRGDANRQILGVLVPITIGGIIMPISMFVDSSLVVNYLMNAGFSSKTATSLFGLSSGVVGSIINMPVVFSVAITTSLLPLVSKAFSVGNKSGVKKNVSLSLLINLIIILPLGLIIFFYSDMIIDFLYGGCLVVSQVNAASTLLKFGSFSVVYLSIVQVSTGALQGINKTIVPVISLCIGVVFKIVLTILLVKNTNIHIYGSMIASGACYAVAGIINLIVLLKNVKFIFLSDLIKCLCSNVLFGAGLAITKKIIFGFASGKVALILSLICAFIILAIIYYMMYKKEINEFLAQKIKRKKRLNNT